MPVSLYISRQDIRDMDGEFIAYLRVKTARQGQSGLGLDAQRDAVQKHLNGGQWHLLDEYVEVETGKNNVRPQLNKALAHCRTTGATLAVAKLDRLSRNQTFLMSIYEGCGEGGVIFCDLPTIPPGPIGRFIVLQMAAVAELEASLISRRTKAALALSKKKLGGYRGGPKVDGKLGAEARRAAADDFAQRLAPMLGDMRAAGLSYREMAAELTAKGIPTAHGGEWHAATARNALMRIG
jgi:DNA invertase Pin-like site-specific DNA recombinase